MTYIVLAEPIPNRPGTWNYLKCTQAFARARYQVLYGDVASETL